MDENKNPVVIPTPERFQRTVYRSRVLKLTSMMQVPKFTFPEARGIFTMEDPNVALSLIFDNGNNNIPFQMKSFFITERGYFPLIDALSTALNWFYDSDKKDLFFKDNEGNLKFNADYNNLKLSLADNTKARKVLTMMPTLGIRNNNPFEGLLLYIISLDSAVVIDVSELSGLIRALQRFSFASEPVILITSWNLALRTKTISVGGFTSSADKISAIINGTSTANLRVDNARPLSSYAKHPFELK